MAAVISSIPQRGLISRAPPFVTLSASAIFRRERGLMDSIT